MFANIYLSIEAMVRDEIVSKANLIGIIEDWFSLHYMSIDWIYGKVEIGGFDKMKGETFIIFYDFNSKTGNIHYYNGLITIFKG